MENDTALVAVDSAEHRIKIQASLPKHLINAWTQKDDLGISRHFNFIDEACLACLYPPTDASKSDSVLIAESFGLPHEEPDIRQMLFNNDNIDEAWLTKIAEAKSFSKEDLFLYVNKPIREFYSKVICGGVIIGNNTDQQVETPMAFQSALAGVLLAAELIIKTENLREQTFDNQIRIDLLHPIKEFLNETVLKPTNRTCICADTDFKNQYLNKYEICSSKNHRSL